MMKNLEGKGLAIKQRETVSTAGTLPAVRRLVGQARRWKPSATSSRRRSEADIVEVAHDFDRTAEKQQNHLEKNSVRL